MDEVLPQEALSVAALSLVGLENALALGLMEAMMI